MSRLRSLIARGSAVVLLAGCVDADPIAPPGGGGSTTPLNVTSTQPAAAAVNVELGAQVLAALDAAPLSQTVSVSSFQLAAGAVDVTRRVLGLGTPPSLEMTAALLPGVTYTATITTGVTGTQGQRLAAPVTWSFTTKAPQVATLSLLAPAVAQLGLARDSVTGRLHMTAPDSVDGKLDYFTCLANCGVAASWTAAVIDSSAFLGQVSAIAVGPAPDLEVHVVYRSETDGDLLYAFCNEVDCSADDAFVTGFVDTVGNQGGAPSMAVDENGTVHVLYQDVDFQLLRYAFCTANCTVLNNWTRIQLAQFAPAGASSAIAIDGTGRIHALYEDVTGVLAYATCASNCGTIASWIRGAVAVTVDNGRAPAVAIDENDRLHVTYFDAVAGDLRYTTCGGSCQFPANWTSLIIAGSNDPDVTGSSSAIAVDENLRLYTVFWDDDALALRYATCPSNCTTLTRWSTAGLDSLPTADRPGSSPRIILTQAGKVSAAFLGADEGEVKYWE